MRYVLGVLFMMLFAGFLACIFLLGVRGHYSVC